MTLLYLTVVPTPPSNTQLPVTLSMMTVPFCPKGWLSIADARLCPVLGMQSIDMAVNTVINFFFLYTRFNGLFLVEVEFLSVILRFLSGKLRK